MLQFHIMNVTLHFVPCLLTAWNPPDAVLWWHGLVAVCFHLSWGFVVSGGSMRLDRVYVHMDVSFWRLSWASAVVGEALLSPFVVHPLLVRPYEEQERHTSSVHTTTLGGGGSDLGTNTLIAFAAGRVRR